MDYYTDYQGKRRAVLVSMNAGEGSSEQAQALEDAVIEWSELVELDDGVDKEVADFVDRLSQVIDWETTSITDVVAAVAFRMKQLNR